MNFQASLMRKYAQPNVAIAISRKYPIATALEIVRCAKPRIEAWNDSASGVLYSLGNAEEGMSDGNNSDRSGDMDDVKCSGGSTADLEAAAPGS